MMMYVTLLRMELLDKRLRDRDTRPRNGRVCTYLQLVTDGECRRREGLQLVTPSVITVTFLPTEQTIHIHSLSSLLDTIQFLHFDI